MNLGSAAFLNIRKYKLSLGNELFRQGGRQPFTLVNDAISEKKGHPLKPIALLERVPLSYGCTACACADYYMLAIIWRSTV